jgi:Ca-activated chloride channel family protein
MSRFELLTALALVASTLFTQALADPVALEVATGSSAVLAGQKQTVYLRVALTGQDDSGRQRRAPVNLALVLDRSGSMSGGKLERAKEAAIHAIGRLHDDDIVSVVAYDSTVEVIVPATKVSEREAIYQAIRRLQPGASTALFAGVSKGAQEIRKFMGLTQKSARRYVSRIVLLSDGLANEGPSTPGALADLGLSLGREGIAVSTLGLGEDYNEDLMTALAQKSDGNHMFIRTENDLLAAFDRELGDALSVVAKNLTVRIECAEGVRPVRVLGREAAISGQTVTSWLNQMYGRQTKYVLLEAELPPGSAGNWMSLAKVEVDGVRIDGSPMEFGTKPIMVEAVGSAELVQQRTNKEVMASVAQQIGAENNQLAMELRDKGNIEESERLLKQNVVYLEKGAADYDSPALRIDAVSNSSMVVKWKDADAYKTVRKEMREYQHETKQQQGGMQYGTLLPPGTKE